jgi:two-component system, sensor histidine kinase and response regulator
MMLSSSGHYGESSRCKELGVASYLTKPIQASDLHEAICRVLNRNDSAPQTRVIPAALGTLPPPIRALRILLAEDNIVNQRVAAGLLSKRGHQVTVANNGLEALAAIDQQTFDVVLMDVQMPKMGGFEATAAIRERERRTGGHQRIIAMTAHAMTGDRERCLGAGMDSYISKPVDPKALYAVLEEEVVTGAPARPVGKSPQPDTPAAPVDRNVLLARLGDDEDLFADIVEVFLDDCPSRLSEIGAAVDARDPERIRTAAHALKGAAGNIAATGLLEAARELEHAGEEARLDAVDAAWRRLESEAMLVMSTLRSFRSAEAAESLVCER